MDEIIKVKCPFCSAQLNVRNVPGIENKNITCPVCGQKSKMSQFQRLSGRPAPQADDTTQLPGMPAARREAPQAERQSPGVLKVLGTGKVYPLKPGRNIVGRASSTPQADVNLETPGEKLLSRQHIVIDIKAVPGKGMIHYVSLYKEKVNNTYVGNDMLEYGDVLVLKPGDVIKLPSISVKLEIPAEQ